MFLCNKFFAQTRQFNIEKGNLQAFRGKTYVYGLLNKDKKSVLCVYQLSHDLKLTDSIWLPQRIPAESYLQPSSDTLHGYLNIYLQQPEKKLVSVSRFDGEFKLKTVVNDIDIARLNSISDFENEIFYYKNEVYTIKNHKDSTGIQFYLNKFVLKSDEKNFEYQFTWQFPFERKNIHSAHIFHVNRKSLLLYVNILNGQKAGQWILTINSSTGKLVRGIKLNDRGEAATYMPGAFLEDTVNKNLLLVGQKFAGNQLKQNENKLSIANAPFVTTYLVEIDSMNEVSNRSEFKIPMTEAKTNSKKNNVSYVVKPVKLVKSREGKINFETDVYKNTGGGLNFLYVNTVRYELFEGEEGLMMEKNTVSADPLVEKFYFNSDKLDMNGKIFVDSLKNFEKLFYRTFSFPVKTGFKTDPNGNPLLLLSKTDSKKNQVSYALIAPVNKIFMLNLLEEIDKSFNPSFTAINAKQFYVGRQNEKNIYTLKAFNW